MISNLICKCKNYPITANWLAQKKIQCFSDHVQGQIYQLPTKNFENRSSSFLKLIRTHTHTQTLLFYNTDFITNDICYYH